MTATLEEIENALLAALRRQSRSPALALGRETVLEAAGVDSLGLIKLLLAIEQRCGVWLPDEDLNAEHLRTVGTLAQRAYQRMTGDGRQDGGANR